jgi:ribose transport system permease protein
VDFYTFYKKYGIYLTLLVVFIFFAVMAPNFLSIENVITILRQISMFGIVVIGVTFEMISGGADLSIGGQMAIIGMIGGILMVNLGIPPLPAALICMVCGILLGGLNAFLVIYLNIIPIVATLGTMLVLQGLAFVVTNAKPLYNMPKSFLFLGQGYIGPIPFPVIVFFVFLVLGWIVMNKTYLGRYVYAVGGNIEAARLGGINITRIRVFVFALTGFLTSIASLIMVSRTNSAQPSAGSNYPFDCMTAVCLGGVSINGGEGKISGTVVGVLIIGLLNSGLILMSVNSNFQSIIKGIVLLAAVGIDCVQNKPKRLKIRV